MRYSSIFISFLSGLSAAMGTNLLVSWADGGLPAGAAAVLAAVSSWILLAGLLAAQASLCGDVERRLALRDASSLNETEREEALKLVLDDVPPGRNLSRRKQSRRLEVTSIVVFALSVAATLLLRG